MAALLAILKIQLEKRRDRSKLARLRNVFRNTSCATSSARAESPTIRLIRLKTGR
jgi:hypothetical protein